MIQASTACASCAPRTSVAWSRDNGDTAGDPCAGGTCLDPTGFPVWELEQVAEALVVGSQGAESTQKLLGVGNIPLELSTYFDRISLPGEGATASVSVTLDGPTGRILRTVVTVPHGQTVVLGTARPFQDRGALILVVRPEIQ